MMASHVVESLDGFTVHVLRNNLLEVRVVPELGAKIMSLRYLPSQREWMWSPPQARLFKNKTGDSFPSGTKIGADECFPTIAACRWQNRSLPDHGEVWTEPWQVEATETSIGTTIQCPISPFHLKRTINLVANEMILDYELRNTGQKGESYLWAFHPLMTIVPGDFIQLPTTSVRVDVSYSCPLGERGTGWSWPNPTKDIQLAQMNFGPQSQAAVKVYSDRLREGRVALCNSQTGDCLEFLFDLNSIDTVGIWINQGGWDGYQHVALEPCRGAPDPLTVAADDWKRCGHLPPGDTARWQIILRSSKIDFL
jgi:galactose mutarotase-like enzyme